MRQTAQTTMSALLNPRTSRILLIAVFRHVSLQTIERSIGCKQRLTVAVNDRLESNLGESFTYQLSDKATIWPGDSNWPHRSPLNILLPLAFAVNADRARKLFCRITKRMDGTPHHMPSCSALNPSSTKSSYEFTSE